MLIFSFASSIGSLRLCEENSSLTALLLPGEEEEVQGAERGESPLLLEAASQIGEYLDGARRSFRLPFAPVGTPFQLAVWGALADIPYGKTTTYKKIAESLGRPKAFRAVGSACRRNPLPIFFPCHRVLASDGSLAGYAGGLEVKRQLLELEASSGNPSVT